MLTGAAINASTHAAIDRGAVLLWPVKKTDKTGYIEHCKAARVDDDGKATSELTGLGSAWMELDVLCTKRRFANRIGSKLTIWSGQHQ
ncbi:MULTISPECIES: hypothetical protein [Streptomyces]|uniref:hypothetical protein n=1 Tax=Streptomyces TaxID=1883 RepID=UPI002E2C226B|nr:MULTISPECIES: hypothetical protein [Streptomyces]